MADQTKPDEKRATYPEAERSFLSVEWERIAKSQRQTINRLEQECDQYAAVMKMAREWAENVLPMEDAVALRDVLASAPDDWLAEHDAELRAESLREAAQEMDEIEAKAEIAEFAAYVEGETGRQSVIDAAAEMQKDPAQWVRTRADRIEREAGLK